MFSATSLTDARSSDGSALRGSVPLIGLEVADSPTAVRDPREMVVQHLLDSLSVVTPLRRQLPAEQGMNLLDVGAGAGRILFINLGR